MASPATYGFLYGSAKYGSSGPSVTIAVTWDDLAGADVISPVGTLDYNQTCQNRIWKQFEQTTSWPDLMDIIGDTAQDIEDQLLEVNDFRFVNTAFGDQLDEIGALVGRSRDGLDDDAYRRAIVVDAHTLFSSGTPWELTELAGSLYPTKDVTFKEYYPASFTLTVSDLTQDEYQLLIDIMKDTPPAGVGALVEVVSSGQMYGPDSTLSNAIEPIGSPGSTTGGDSELFSNFSHAQKLG